MRIKKYAFFSMLVLLSTLSCKPSQKEPNLKVDDIIESLSQDSINFIFQDSTTIGEKGKYKIEVTQTYFKNDDINTLLNISLFQKMDDSWKSIQNLKDTIEYVSNPDIDLMDINNDGLLDLNFVYALAGRGYNDVRKHYVFDRKQNRLIAIKNSPQYPNLTYNEELDCIESHIGHGGYSTIFLQLKNDSLEEFASIDLYDDKRIVSITHKEGQKTIISETPYSLDNEDADITYGDYDILSLKKYKK